MFTPEGRSISIRQLKASFNNTIYCDSNCRGSFQVVITLHVQMIFILRARTMSIHRVCVRMFKVTMPNFKN